MERETLGVDNFGEWKMYNTITTLEKKCCIHVFVMRLYKCMDKLNLSPVYDCKKFFLVYAKVGT